MSQQADTPDARIDAYLCARGAGDHLQGLGLAGLVARWEVVVADVGRGATGDLDDYLNDLDLRRIIRDVLVAVVDTRGPLLARLRVADGRFTEITRPVDENLWGPSGPGDPRTTPWYFRVPLHPSAELAEDLTARGI